MPAAYDNNDALVEKPSDYDIETIQDHYVFYLERDVLGKLSNLWLSLCDSYGQYGPKDYKCKNLSQYLSISVDFAKHGECVRKEVPQRYQSLVRKFPDFMQKKSYQTRESSSILSILFKNIEIETSINEFISHDQEVSIKFNYDLDPKIINQAPNLNIVIDYLHLVLQEIVIPMTKELKEYMRDFRISTEGEIFCNDLSFKYLQSNPMKQRNDEETEDTKQNLQELKRLLIEIY